LFVLEDVITDWVEVQASMVDQVVTETMLYSSVGRALAAGVTVHKLVKVSGATKGDAAFARQVRRKYL
jgi:hypothetical protein